jgi:hypothetical protein
VSTAIVVTERMRVYEYAPGMRPARASVPGGQNGEREGTRRQE